MKIRKFMLGLIACIIAFVAVVSNNIFATDQLSEALDQILNEEGKLVITDTSMCENMEFFLQECLQKYKTNSYNFTVENYNKEDSTCYVSILGLGGRTVEVVFEEKISDDFKSILTDGKLKIPSSTKNGVENVLGTYLYNMTESSDDYRYDVAVYSDMNGFKVLINEDYTKATIRMQDKSWRVLEQHIVDLTYLTEQSEAFRNELNEDGKIVFNSRKPKTEDELGCLFELLFMKDNFEKGYSFGYPSEDFTSMDFTINGGTLNEETHRVEIVYNYDKKVEEKLQEFVKNFPEDIEFFNVKDLELVNYWINNVETDDTEHLDAYSGELKKAINNNNIEYYVDNRAGTDEVFYIERLGIAIFKFDGIVYHIDSDLGTKAENVIYVPNETGNTREELIAAAQKRINEYLGKTDIVTVSYSGKAYDIWLKGQYNLCKWMWEQDDSDMTLEEFIANKDNYISYNSFEEATGIEGATEDQDIFKLNIKVNGKEKSFDIFIKKDTSKMIVPTYASTDVHTDIKISSEVAAIPLDTCIQAKQLTSGEEYTKIMDILDVEESLMFDLKLYSDSLSNYVKHLENGTFEVRIPIPDGWDEKEFVACYVTEDEEVEFYDVNPIENYLIFNTNHFSIYTLAEKSKINDNSNNNDNNSGNISGNTPNGSESTGNITNNDKEINVNPQTGDNVLFFGIILVVAVIGITIINKLEKRCKIKQ